MANKKIKIEKFNERIEEGRALDYLNVAIIVAAASPSILVLLLVLIVLRRINKILHPKFNSCSRAFCRMSDIFSRRTGTMVRHLIKSLS